MNRFLLPLLLLAFNPCTLVAQDVAIVLTGIVYDRDMTDEESAMARERAERAKQNGEPSSYSLECLRILDARAKTLDRVSTTTILEVGKSVRLKADTRDMLLEAHLSVLKVDDTSCELEATWSVGAIVGATTVTVNSLGKKTLTLNQLEYIGAAGVKALAKGQPQTGHIVQTMLVIPGKDHPLTSKKIGEDLGLELSRRIQIPRPGKITSR